jgi:DHA1 family multidrug resistance protein-like MFS transporter
MPTSCCKSSEQVAHFHTDFCSAASVIAANTILRSFGAGAFPLFTQQMFNNLGIQWAGTLLACLATVMIPIPIGFYIYGSRLRKRSVYSEPTTKKEDVESPSESDETKI